MTNYKPISLLTVFSKVLEKAVHSRISQHLHANNVLDTEHYTDLGKRYQLKMLLSDYKIVYSHLLTKKCTSQAFSMIWLRLLIE
jgi:hypothetical protein